MALAVIKSELLTGAVNGHQLQHSPCLLGGFLCALVFHWTTLKWRSHFPFSRHIWSTPPLAKDHCCVREEKQIVPALNSKSSQRKRAQRQLVVFCSFTYCKVMVFTKGNCGEGMETCERDVTRAEGVSNSK